MNPSLTVVLPIHNAESSLTQGVDHLLEVASELTPRVELLIVDDGSTDDTYDIACELATKYPQVRVMRQAHRRGLGPTLEAVRRRVRSDVMMVNDGVSKINAEELRVLWNRRFDARPTNDANVADLLRPTQNQRAMGAAHARVTGFQLVEGLSEEQPAAAPIIPSPDSSAAATGVGGIPPLPRPNFLGTVGDFALGE